MRYTASDTDPKFTTLLETAQREPVFIERDRQEVAVLVSAAATTASAASPHKSSWNSATRWRPRPLPMA